MVTEIKNSTNWFRRHWILTIIMVVFLIGIIGSIINTPPDNTTPTTQNEAPKVYYAGDRVIVGNFAYTVNSYYTTDKVGQDLMDNFMGAQASGMFLVLDITIENVAKESKTLWGNSIQIVDDQDRTFDHSFNAEIYLPQGQQLAFAQMQPGLPKTGKLVFDVPKNIRGSVKISSDNILSGDKVYVSWNKKGA